MSDGALIVDLTPSISSQTEGSTDLLFKCAREVPKEYLWRLPGGLPGFAFRHLNESKQFEKFVLSDDVHDRIRAIELLERRCPGIAVKSLEAWPFPRGRAIHLWRSNALENVTCHSIVQNIPSGTLGTLRRLSKSESPVKNNARISAVRVTREDVSAYVQVYRNSRLTLEEVARSEITSHPVFLRLDIRRQPRLIEVYSSYRDARKALVRFLEWIFRRSIPVRRGSAQSDFFSALEFSEEHIKRLAPRLNMSYISVHGPDPTGLFGERMFVGKTVGDSVEPLDPAVKEVADQEDVDNFRRSFSLEFEHPNGYREATVVRFEFASMQSHILFEERASRPAIDHLISALLSEVS